MRAIGRYLVLATISVLFSACGGGGNGQPQRAQLVDPPAAPEITVSADIKQLIFSWDSVATATHYRLLENPDGHSGFTQVGGNISSGDTSAAREIAVHLHDWLSALYLVQACNTGGCTDSTQVSTADVMLETIGYFKASDSEVGDGFGGSVRLSADGNTLAVSAHKFGRIVSDSFTARAGVVYVFQNDGTHWYEQATINVPIVDNIPADIWVNLSNVSAMDLSADGSTLAIGDPAVAYYDEFATFPYPYSQGAVHIIRQTDTGWSLEAWLRGGREGESFGASVALSSDGKTLVVGAPGDSLCGTGVNPPQDLSCWIEDAGAVHVFRFVDDQWAYEAFIKGNASWYSNLGQRVALSDDGNLLAVYVPNEYVEFEPGEWVWDYNYLGRVYLYRFDGSEWKETARIAPLDETESIGLVALSPDGSTLVTDLCTYVEDESRWECVVNELRRFDGMNWIVQATMPRRHVCDMSADGNILAVCNGGDDSDATGINGHRNNNLAESSGAADILEFDGTAWSQRAYVKASNTGAGDLFGRAALSADGMTLVVGAPREDSGANGINGDQADNSAEDAGAVYIY